MHNLGCLCPTQDKFYNVQGQGFVIQRAESGAAGAARKLGKADKALQPLRRAGRSRRRHSRRSSGSGGEGTLSPEEQLGLIRSAVRQDPMGSVLLLEGATVVGSQQLVSMHLIPQLGRSLKKCTGMCSISPAGHLSSLAMMAHDCRTSVTRMWSFWVSRAAAALPPGVMSPPTPQSPASSLSPSRTSRAVSRRRCRGMCST
jgi:hypothetical protein